MHLRCALGVLAAVGAVVLAAPPAPAGPLMPGPSHRSAADTAFARVAPAPPGALLGIPGWGRPSGPGELHTYNVFVEARLAVVPEAFARRIATVLRDPRGWSALGHAFQRVPPDHPADFRLVLASPSTSAQLCLPVVTYGRYSCYDGHDAVVNYMRWTDGAPGYRSMGRYRAYVINHEVGHALHFGHTTCPAPGALAPVMVQQTKGLGGCRPNPWPRFTGW